MITVFSAESHWDSTCFTTQVAFPCLDTSHEGYRTKSPPLVRNKGIIFSFKTLQYYNIDTKSERLRKILILCNNSPENIDEKTINTLSDAELFYLRHSVPWRAFSLRFQNINPNQLWKIFPYIAWDYVFKAAGKSEHLLIQFSDFVYFWTIHSSYLTKNVLIKFHDKFNWLSLSSSNKLDRELVRKFHNKYDLDWNYLLSHLPFSEYELEKYAKCHSLDWTYIACHAKTQLSPTMLRRHHKQIFKGQVDIDYLVRAKPIPCDILDIYSNLLNWEYVREKQTKLEPWFIMKYHDKLATMSKEYPETARKFIMGQSVLPAIYVFDKNEWDKEFYPKNDPSKRPQVVNPILPDPKKLDNFQAIYFTSHALKDPKNNGLEFYPNEDSPYYVVVKPDKFYKIGVSTLSYTGDEDTLEFASVYIRKMTKYVAIYAFPSQEWRKEYFDIGDLSRTPQPIAPIIPDDQQLKRFRIVYYTSVHLNNYFKAGLHFHPEEDPPYYEVTRPWMFYEGKGKPRATNPSWPTLRPVLKKNGFSQAKNRSKIFNAFLREHHYM